MQQLVETPVALGQLEEQRLRSFVWYSLDNLQVITGIRHTFTSASTFGFRLPNLTFNGRKNVTRVAKQAEDGELKGSNLEPNMSL